LFYETLKEICNKKKTSPSAVCDALGMSRGNITEWKKGRSPKMDTVIKIADHLGVSPIKLFPKKASEE
jgi:transcriptional regulator with XRE-family HTH domain